MNNTAMITLDRDAEGELIFFVEVHGERYQVNDIFFDNDVYAYFADRHIITKLQRKYMRKGIGEDDKMVDVSRRMYD